MSGWLRIDEWWRDLRHSGRNLWRFPVHTTTIVSLLALALGATVTVFSLVNALVIRELPVERPEELIAIKRMSKGAAQGISVPLFEELRTRMTSTALAAVSDVPLPIAPADGTLVDAAEIPAVLVSGTYFEVLGVQPAVGRLIGQEDDRFADPRSVAVLSHGLWTTRFGGDRGVVGRDLLVPGGRLTVIGVAPKEFRAMAGDRGLGGDLYLPLNLQPMVGGTDRRRNPGSSILRVFARLTAGGSIDRVQVEAGAIYRHLPPPLSRPDSSLEVTSARRGFGNQLATQYWPPLRVLFVAALLLLAIACANIAGLLIARAGARRHEIAVRQALGSGRGRIIRQLFIESALLVAAGGTLGLAWSAAGARAMAAMALPQGSPDLDLSVDGSVVLFALGISAATTFAFGLLPAVQLFRRGSDAALRAASRGSTRRHRHVLQRVMISAQVMLAVVLLTSTVAFARSLVRLYAADIGFDRRGMVIATVDARPAGVQTADQYALLADDLVSQLSRHPGVESVTVAAAGFFGGGRRSTRTYQVNDREYGGPDDPPLYINEVSNDYLRAFRVAVAEGRDLTVDDHTGTARVAVVNQEFARRYAGGASALGSRLRLDTVPDSIEIIGVVRDTKLNNPREETVPIAFLPFEQFPARFNHICIRTSRTDVEALQALRTAIVSVNPRVRVTRVQTIDDVLKETVSQDLLLMRLSAVLGLSAVVLVSFGVYGLISGLVATRTREIGVRLAIGADPRRVLREVIRDAIARVAPGLVVGIILSSVMGRLIASQLFEVTPSGPATVGLVASLIVTVTIASSYLPARRAARTSPMIAMRTE